MESRPRPPAGEQRRGDEQHREIDQAGRAERGQHVDLLEAQQLAPLGIVAAAHPGFRQRGVQVDHVRHHRGPDDPGNEQQPVAGQAWYQPGRDAPRAGPDRGQVVGETEEDDAEQAGDRQLERPVAALLQGQDAERDHRRDQPGRQHRHVEEQTQPQRGPDELGQVRRHGDELGLNPQAEGCRPPEPLAAQLRQVAPGGDTGLGGEVLHQHGHQVGHHDRPCECVAEPRPGREVGGEVTRIDVGHRGDERRAEQGQDPAGPPTGPQHLQLLGGAVTADSAGRPGTPAVTGPSRPYSPETPSRPPAPPGLLPSARTSADRRSQPE